MPAPAAVPAVTIAAGPRVSEGTAVQFTVRADPAPEAHLVVSVSVTETGSMLSAPRPRTVTIRAGSKVGTLSVHTDNDEQDEPSSTVTATLTSGSGYTRGAARSASVTVIDDDDPPPPAVPEVTITSGSAVTEGTAVQFTLRAQPAPAAHLVVNVTLTETGNMLSAPRPRTVTITAGTNSATLSAHTDGDQQDEPDSRVTATLTSGTGYTLGSARTAGVTVLDDDEPAPVIPPEVTIETGLVAVIEGTALQFTVRAEPAPVTDLAVSVSVTETGDMLPVSRRNSVRIATGDTAATLVVTTVADEVDEPDSTVTATVIGGTGYTLGSATSANVTVTDDDATPLPVVRLLSVSPMELQEYDRLHITLSMEAQSDPPDIGGEVRVYEWQVATIPFFFHGVPGRQTETLTYDLGGFGPGGIPLNLDCVPPVVIRLLESRSDVYIVGEPAELHVPVDHPGLAPLSQRAGWSRRTEWPRRTER